MLGGEHGWGAGWVHLSAAAVGMGEGGGLGSRGREQVVLPMNNPSEGLFAAAPASNWMLAMHLSGTALRG